MASTAESAKSSTVTMSVDLTGIDDSSVQDSIAEKKAQHPMVQVFAAIIEGDIPRLKVLAKIQDLNFVSHTTIFKQIPSLFYFSLSPGLISPLAFAVNFSTPEMLKALFELGAEVTKPYLNYPSLLETARKGNVAPEKLILLCEQALKEAKEKYNLNFENVDPRFRQAFLGDIQALQVSGANFRTKAINTAGPRALNIIMVAAIGGNVETLQYLFYAGGLRKPSKGDGFEYPVFRTEHPRENQRWSMLEAIAMGGYISVFNFFQDPLIKAIILAEGRFYALSNAMHYSHSEFLQNLLSIDPTIIYETSSERIGFSSLMEAALRGNEIYFNMILQCDQRERIKMQAKGLPPRPSLLLATDEFRSNTLIYAARGKNAKIVAKILDLAPELLYETTFQGKTALIEAAWVGDPDCVEVILQRDQISKQQLLSMTAFHDEKLSACFYAVRGQHIAVLEILKRFNPDAFREALFLEGKKGWNVLHFAIHEEKFDSVRFLVEKCDPDGQLVTSCTKLNTNVVQKAASVNFDIYKYLVARRPELLTKRGKEGMTTLMYAVVIFENQFEEFDGRRIHIVKDILARVPEMIFLKDEMGRTVFDHLEQNLKWLSKLKPDPKNYANQSDFDKSVANLKTANETLTQLGNLLHHYLCVFLNEKKAHAEIRPAEAEQVVSLQIKIKAQEKLLTAKEGVIHANTAQLRSQGNTLTLLRQRLLEKEALIKRLKNQLQLKEQLKESIGTNGIQRTETVKQP